MRSQVAPARALRKISMAKNHRHDPPKANRIRVRLWPRRGLSQRDEDCLAAWLDYWRSAQLWEWAGQTLAGEMCTDAEFTTADVIDHLCVLQAEACLARIDLSLPYAEGSEPRGWLSVYRRLTVLGALCDLYADRLVSADAVVQALGGFVQSAPDSDVQGEA